MRTIFFFAQNVFKKLRNLTLYHSIQTLRPCRRRLLQTLWEKEKMLVTSIFSYPHVLSLTHSHTMTPFDASGKEAFEKEHFGKRRNCLYKQFLLFPQCFLLYQRQKLSFFVPFNLTNAFNSYQSKILSSANGLM